MKMKHCKNKNLSFVFIYFCPNVVHVLRGFLTHPGRTSRLRMSVTSEDVERPQNEKTIKSGCSLRNFLIFAAALAVFAIVLFILAAGTSSNISTKTTVSTAENVDDLRNSSTQFTQNSTPGSDMFIFEYKWKVYAVNPSDSELKSRFLFRTEPPSTWHFIEDVQFLLVL